ncbi:Na/Pi cotransporter family protein [Thermohalobacter berrensis]|uniref:Na/Pi cotransporter family protein n=1 Tax=Thermohalobacter berrensis TaxID=99594 RepID=UPI001FAB2326|nr:Na/Pi symporter [Thermohalobacter berrensis]
MIFFGVIGGLSLFLFGIKLMSSTFEDIVSLKVKNNLEKFTSNKLIGLLLGIVATALLQSSSASTLIVISLVHSNLINLYNAVPILMGANIGTTFTAQLIAFKLDDFIPYFFILAIILLPFYNKRKFRTLIRVILSLGIIFLGMRILENSISSTNINEKIIILIKNIETNKIAGIFLGFIITSIIQSSSTGIAILQVLASNLIIPVKTSIPILLGQNIGTCTDTFIGSLITNKKGKQAALIHIMFNILGVVIFYFLIDYLYSIVHGLSPENPSKQLANAHTIFNVSTTIILFPIYPLLIKISKKIIPD